ncbi:unnamed protein product [Urochloa decumbens]|uniref:Protein kinase domain-containing protein n=1 Tax=Urochloa decumbens TaxID=240449 RepID=A0ABC9BPP6_9POAL
MLLLQLAAVATPVTAAGEQQTAERPIALPGCSDKCGNISIPYPFGINKGCYFDSSFEVVCNEPTAPSYLAVPMIYNMTGYYIGDNDNPAPGPMTNATWQTVELIDFDVSRGEARVGIPVSSDCSINSTYHELNMFSMQVNVSDFGRGTFVFSTTRNVLLGIGQSVQAKVYGEMSATNVSASCTSLFDTPSAAKNGSCSAGLGCCQADLPPGLGVLAFGMKRQTNSMWLEFPCTNAMAVERSWYNFSLQDLVDPNKFPPRSVPIVLDWAIRNGSCPAEEGAPLPMACRSDNSRCVDATTAPGYLCKCKDGYDGNPYIVGGCQGKHAYEHVIILVSLHCLTVQFLRYSNPNIILMSVCFGINILSYEICILAMGYARTRWGATIATANLDPKATAKMEHAGRCVIGIASLVVILVLLKLLMHQKRKTREFFIKNGGPILEKVNNIKIFKKEELKPILQKSNVIGKGGFGEVYKGIIESQVVAIKKSINVDKSQEKQFANEIIIQSRVIHKNITKLIGCCLEVDVPMLVYEFVPQGSLHDLLYGSNKMSLRLDKRLSIAAGAAEGLAYMHSKTSTTILHGDIKPSNILLDDNFTPKISDFGISRLIAIDKTHTNVVVGDMCYIDPIYLQSGLLTKQSDVYSFGITLLELVTRQKDDLGGNGRLSKAFLNAYTEEKGAIELFDSEILVENDIEVLNKLATLIVECLNLDVDRRPEMINVAERLETMKRLHIKQSDACGSTNA